MYDTWKLEGGLTLGFCSGCLVVIIVVLLTLLQSGVYITRILFSL